jgi:hypothetical protein
MGRFDRVVAILDRAAGDEPSSSRRELAEAKRCLMMCARLGFDGRERAYVLPAPKTRTPTSEFRVMEDHETDERRYWTEVTIDGAHVRPGARWTLIAPHGHPPQPVSEDMPPNAMAPVKVDVCLTHLPPGGLREALAVRGAFGASVSLAELRAFKDGDTPFVLLAGVDEAWARSVLLALPPRLQAAIELRRSK